MPEPSLGEISVADARRKMLEGLPALPLEAVALTTALGRTLGEAVVALRDQPPFAVSAMDGYAIGPGASLGPYRLLGESAAGRPYEGGLGPAEAVRIFTGAAVPSGGRIIVQERALRRDDGIYFEALGADLDWIRPRGGDFKSGETLLSPGVRLDPWRLALAAAAGKGVVTVSRRPRVAILSTGEEIIRAGGSPGPAQIFDSAGPALSALITAWGGVAAPLEPVRDDQDAIAAAAAAADCDLIVTVGGASVGDHDLTKPRFGLWDLSWRSTRFDCDPANPPGSAVCRTDAVRWGCLATRPRRWSAPSSFCVRWFWPGKGRTPAFRWRGFLWARPFRRSGRASTGCGRGLKRETATSKSCPFPIRTQASSASSPRPMPWSAVRLENRLRRRASGSRFYG